MRLERSTLEALDQIMIGAVALTALALAEASSASDITLPQWRVLVVVGETAAGLRVKEIAEHIGASSPSASRLIRRMERAGLVTSDRDDSDRRATIVRLTRQGATVRSSVLAERGRLLKLRFGSYPGRLPRDLDRGLRMIGEILSSS